MAVIDAVMGDRGMKISFVEFVEFGFEGMKMLFVALELRGRFFEVFSLDSVLLEADKIGFCRFGTAFLGALDALLKMFDPRIFFFEGDLA